MISTASEKTPSWLSHFSKQKVSSMLRTRQYLNGQRVAVFTGYVTDYFTALADALSKAIVVGDNWLAIHCRNTVGGQFIDAGIEAGTELKKP
jgi:hypothetical protein